MTDRELEEILERARGYSMGDSFDIADILKSIEELKSAIDFVIEKSLDENPSIENDDDINWDEVDLRLIRR